MADDKFTDVNSNTDGAVWNVTGDSDAAKGAWTNTGDPDWKSLYKPDPNKKDDGTTPDDPPPPVLTSADSGWPLPATGESSGGGGGKPTGAAPEVPDFSITLGSLHDAQAGLLPSADTAVAAYTSLRASSIAKAPWIFQQHAEGDQATTQTGYMYTSGNSGLVTSTSGGPDPDLAAQTPKLKAVLDTALLAIADAVHTVGDYAAYMNTAAQTYTYADKQSFINPTDKAT